MAEQVRAPQRALPFSVDMPLRRHVVAALIPGDETAPLRARLELEALDSAPEREYKPEILARMKALGVDHGQGFLPHRPQPINRASQIMVSPPPRLPSATTTLA